MGRPLNIKRKDGLGYWPLWCLSEEEYYGLTSGKDTALHKHDQMYYTETELSFDGVLDSRYYTETEIDAALANYVLVDGTREMTADWNIGSYKLGIGIAPTHELDVFGIVRAQATGEPAVLGVERTDGTWGQIAAGPSSVAFTWENGSNFNFGEYQAGKVLGDAFVGTTHATLKSGGNFGLSIDPVYRLDVYHGTSDYPIRAQSGDTRAFATFQDNSTTGAGYVAVGAAGDNLILRSFNQDSMTLASTQIQANLEFYAAAGLTLDGGISVDSILDQDDFYSDSDTALATQQSIKAYIDGAISGLSIGNYALLDGSNQPFTGALDILMTDPQMKFSEDANNYDLIKRTSSNDQFEIGHYVGGVEKGHVVFDSTGGVGIQGDTVVNIDAASGLCTINATGFAGTVFKDEDNMTSNSATHLASQQSIKAYVDNKNYLDLGSILTSNGSYVGTKISVVIDDASTVFGNVLAQAADFHYDRADADAATTSVGLVLALSSGSGSKEVLVEGMACNTSWSWSAGLLYLSTTTGAMTQTAPSGTGDQVVAVGWALSATCIYFKPSLVLVEVA